MKIVFFLAVSIFLISCSDNSLSKNIDPENSSTSPLAIPEATTLSEDIPKASEWVVKYFAQDSIILDYSIQSIKQLDNFIEKNSENGKAKDSSKLSSDLGYKLFAIGSYVGQVIIKGSSGSKWVTDDSDPNGEVNIEIQMKDGTKMWPVQRVLKRYQNGDEDNLYSYVYLVSQGLLK